MYSYAQGNPVNLTDPTGLHSGNHAIYCSPLTGYDRLYCESIVRDIFPSEYLTLSDLYLLDLCEIYGSYCNSACESLQKRGVTFIELNADSLPHSLSLNTPVAYGWWWHYGLNTSPGWWNRNGQNHVSFSTVVAFALGAEMGTLYVDWPKAKPYMAEAFGRKAWGEGFYYFLGGRQSVTDRINCAVYPQEGDSCGGWFNGFDPVDFAVVLEDISTNYNVKEVALPLAISILTNGIWKEGVVPNRPYEWGNPTTGSPEQILSTISDFNNMGAAYNQVFWFSDEYYDGYPTRKNDKGEDILTKKGNSIYELFFIITQQQINNLCGNGSCVEQ